MLLSLAVTALGAAALGVGLILARGLMGRVCTDAKALAPTNAHAAAFFAGLPPVLNIAHRGASTLAPEHSLEAFQLALAQGAHVLELDLRLTRDAALLVAHDRTLRRTLGRQEAWSELTVAELAALAGSRMPLSLDQVLERFPTTHFNLELKDDTLDAARALAGTLARHDAGGRVLVASLNARVLEELRIATRGAVATSASTDEALDCYSCYLMGRSCIGRYSALQLPALGWLGITSPRFIAWAHERGLAVHYWTIDDATRMAELLARGADGIMTNRPDRLAQVLAGSR
ncbi:MAG TPA: glycerophosphodiester phosphodiesterase family protein [Polyangiaceae bacterium]|nr:glycerophosphodiester phosphodiesterase family protein [Polyangiaceae bacterium]